VRDGGRPAASVIAAAASASAVAASASASSLSALRPPVDSGAALAAPSRRADAGASRLRLDRPIELGPWGAVAAPWGGAVFLTRDDELFWVPIDRSANATASEKLKTAKIAVQPPAMTASLRSYWISGGRLVARSFARPATVGPLETLASDAHDGTLVAAVAAGSRDAVAYIARPSSAKSDRRARLWVQGEPTTYGLSDDGAGASSVAVGGSERRIWAVSLDERTAMSPLHARAVDLPDVGPARRGPDVVVWVGPSCEVHTEIALGAPGGEPVVIAPLARDATSFGLAAIPIGREPHMDSVSRFTPYPNGLDPAPVAAADACGGTWVAYVRPKAAAPGSPSVLAIAPLEGGALGEETVAAESDRIPSASFAGGTLVYWADGRTWARAARCK
jgi:hypothetical protein